ncbi:biotin--[acetyl-CoA-carboxylase] ligase [Subtercola boreus]|uniref:biotin--[biotin carboxyl-carrier protein] ligase n=1 Tax=Subtercola boreus TaxID=120213 RepID=A0A3E0WDB6_9MICO|nr:biotin--[acetyl-CoA-carboxylase] ligase [Subtercola boreus]RFA22619.1 hypothetical protein B7R24_03110 [Subtercola boreus]RFA22975.1 hypothetical protein B7R23_03105 [Subtercola boreus]RFA28726.1 hypothetical protein B7R25_03120 [Subtercola boreus]
MQAPQSRALVPRLDWLSEAGSTNAVLVAAAGGPDAAGWPDLSVVVTDNQTAGRGRLGRVWSAPAGASLAISVLLRPPLMGGEALPIEALGWLPLIGGAAMARAVNGVLGRGAASAAGAGTGGAGTPRAAVKWPNDVLIDGAKVCGVLSELLPGATGVVVGAGVNLFLTREQLPVATATSLALAVASGFTADDVLAGYLVEFTRLYRSFLAAGGDAAESGVASVVSELCDTLGRRVRVELPTGDVVMGQADALDAAGRLRVTRDDGTGELVVSAGDVTHLRY